MVGVNSFIHRLGTVAVFATLFAAIQVNGNKGCVFDFEHSSDYDLECNDIKNSWTINDDAKDSPNKKVLILAPEQTGCFKTKSSVILNTTSPVSLRFYREGAKNENEKIRLRLIPKEGSCTDEECVWELTSDPHYKSGEWVTVEHKFPLKSMKEYYVQLQVEKNKGKFLVDHISLPTAFGDSSRCPAVEGGIRAAAEAGMNEINLASQLIATAAADNKSSGGGGGGSSGGGGGSSTKSLSPGFAEISKNLMLTSASVLTLNNLLN